MASHSRRRIVRALQILAVSGLAAPCAGGETILWQNPSGGQWNDTANWSPMLVPSVTDAAIFRVPGEFTVYGPGAASLLSINQGNVSLIGPLTVSAQSFSLLVTGENESSPTLRLLGEAHAGNVHVGYTPGDSRLIVEGDLRLRFDNPLHPDAMISLGALPEGGGVSTPEIGGSGLLRVVGENARVGAEAEGPRPNMLFRRHTGASGRLEVRDGGAVDAAEIDFQQGVIDIEGEGSRVRAESIRSNAGVDAIEPAPQLIAVRDGGELSVSLGERPRLNFESDPVNILVDGGRLHAEEIRLWTSSDLILKNGGRLETSELDTGLAHFRLRDEHSLLRINAVSDRLFDFQLVRAVEGLITKNAVVDAPMGAFVAIQCDATEISAGARIEHGSAVPEDVDRPPSNVNWLAFFASDVLRIYDRVRIEAVGSLTMTAPALELTGPDTQLVARGVGVDRPPMGGAGGRRRAFGLLRISSHSAAIHDDVLIRSEGLIVEPTSGLAAPGRIAFTDDVVVSVQQAANLRASRASGTMRNHEIVIGHGAVLRAAQVSLSPKDLDDPPSTGPIVSGGGVIASDVINGAVLAPGDGVGAMTIRGDYTQSEALAFLWDFSTQQRHEERLLSAGALHIDIATTGRPRTDLLDISGEATLDGELAFFTDGPGVVRPGEYVFLSASSVTGEFATVTLPPVPRGLAAEVVYEPTRVLLRVRRRADLTGDQRVNGRDLAALLERWGAEDATADLTGDGVVSGPDLAAMLADWDG